MNVQTLRKYFVVAPGSTENNSAELTVSLRKHSSRRRLWVGFTLWHQDLIAPSYEVEGFAQVIFRDRDGIEEQGPQCLPYWYTKLLSPGRLPALGLPMNLRDYPSTLDDHPHVIPEVQGNLVVSFCTPTGDPYLYEVPRYPVDPDDSHVQAVLRWNVTVNGLSSVAMPGIPMHAVLISG